MFNWFDIAIHEAIQQEHVKCYVQTFQALRCGWNQAEFQIQKKTVKILVLCCSSFHSTFCRQFDDTNLDHPARMANRNLIKKSHKYWCGNIGCERFESAQERFLSSALLIGPGNRIDFSNLTERVLIDDLSLYNGFCIQTGSYNINYPITESNWNHQPVWINYALLHHKRIPDVCSRHDR